METTTNGGIYYGMIGADFAAQVLHKAFQQNHFDEKILSIYDQLWKTKLAPAIQTGLRLMELYSNLTDSQINLLFSIVSMNRIMPLIKKNLNFDWHQSLISSLITNPLINRFLGTKIQNL